MRRDLMQDTVARPMIGDRWALMNRQEEGFASFAYEYRSLDALVADWNVKLGERGTDKYGEFVRVIRMVTCDKCLERADVIACPVCAKTYARCEAHGGEAGARRSLKSHAGLYHGPSSDT